MESEAAPKFPPSVRKKFLPLQCSHRWAIKCLLSRDRQLAVSDHPWRTADQKPSPERGVSFVAAPCDLIFAPKIGLAF